MGLEVDQRKREEETNFLPGAVLQWEY